MSPRTSTDSEPELEGLMDRVNEEHDGEAAAALDVDAEFGGREARQKLERKLLRKLDARMSILVLIYVLNYVRLSRYCCPVSRFSHVRSQVDRNNAS